jgi:hypothetical protein
MRAPEETLDALGVPQRVRDRWAREIERCETRYQLSVTMECHQIEAYLIGTYGA